MIERPSYDGNGLVNLVAELEHRTRGQSESPRLDNADFARHRGHRSTVFVIFDGLGSHQISHPNARDLASCHIGDMDAPFPTTTTVSLATVATGLPPSQHGLIAYQLWIPQVNVVVNTIHMTTMWGDKIDQRHDSFLPGPNLWERLSSAGTKAVTVQPANFDRTPLSLALYRGASFVPYENEGEAVARTIEAARDPHAFVFLYVPHVDFAAHVAGQQSEEYDQAMAYANRIWADLAEGLAADVLLVGTADHGHIDIGPAGKVNLSREQESGLTLYGDARAMFVRGDGARLADDLPGTWAPFSDVADLWGPGPLHPSFEERRPDGIIFADDGRVIFHARSNNRLVGHHGGLTLPERSIPLLVRP